jgi:hypothetical protein
MPTMSTLDASTIHTPILNRMAEDHGIPALIKQELKKNGPCTLETLLNRLSTCTWNQVFVAVDTLSRNGTLILQPYARFEYMISMAPLHGRTRHIPTEARGYRDSCQEVVVPVRGPAFPPVRPKNKTEKGEHA